MQQLVDECNPGAVEVIGRVDRDDLILRVAMAAVGGINPCLAPEAEKGRPSLGGLDDSPFNPADIQSGGEGF